MAALGFNDSWSVKDALDWTSEYLAGKGDEHPRLSAEWLISDATGLSRVELYINFARPLSMDERALLRESVRRRAQGEPLQYLSGQAAFRHILLKLEKGVLIPRPETELLVEEALPFVDKPIAARGYATVLDLCTGSGAIALSIAKERGAAQVIATDICPKAVALASENAANLRLSERVSVLECDLAQAVPQELLGSFDLIISNPPYVPSALMQQLPAEVTQFEPALALDGGADGLDIFRRILSLAPDYLRPGGALICELHEDCLEQAAALCGADLDVRIIRDLADKPRFLLAVFPGEAPSTLISIDRDAPDEALIRKAAQALEAGEALVLPTDTVYGLGLSVSHAQSPELIYEIKRRDPDKAIPLLLADPSDLDVFAANPPDYARRLAQAYWPGALTIVLEASSRVPQAFRAQDGTVALRCPDCNAARALIRAAGGALAVSSANTQSKPAPASIAQLEPAVACRAAYVMDAGPSQVGVASSGVTCSGPEPVVWRESAISAADIIATANAIPVPHD